MRKDGYYIVGKFPGTTVTNQCYTYEEIRGR
jgi:hypothetical protein